MSVLKQLMDELSEYMIASEIKGQALKLAAEMGPWLAVKAHVAAHLGCVNHILSRKEFQGACAPTQNHLPRLKVILDDFFTKLTEAEEAFNREDVQWHKENPGFGDKHLTPANKGA